ncbi:hypothetical protein [Escherichia coli]|uniref:hypothetical protein n=1 Tax=Escherichia coli TaxID=562 RepID=UPI0039871C95
MVIILLPRNHGDFFTRVLPFSPVLLVASRCVTACHHHVTLIAKAGLTSTGTGSPMYCYRPAGWWSN